MTIRLSLDQTNTRYSKIYSVYLDDIFIGNVQSGNKNYWVAQFGIKWHTFKTRTMGVHWLQLMHSSKGDSEWACSILNIEPCNRCKELNND